MPAVKGQEEELPQGKEMPKERKLCRSFPAVPDIQGYQDTPPFSDTRLYPSASGFFYEPNLSLETVVSERVLNCAQRKIKQSSESSLALESKGTNEGFKCFCLIAVPLL